MLISLLLLCTALFAQQKGTFTDTRDGKIYKTTKIGEQVWMKDNLNYKTDSSWCYGNKDFNCDKYGRLYKWDTAREVCPNGWHFYGFSALPGGMRYFHGGTFRSLGSFGYYWSDHKFNSKLAYFWTMRSGREEVEDAIDYKTYGLSVRCLQDQ